jgi:hypothetical protein
MSPATEKLREWLYRLRDGPPSAAQSEINKLIYDLLCEDAGIKADAPPTTAPLDFGEPWDIRCERFYDCDGQLADSGDARRIRIVACVNALRGVRNPEVVRLLIETLRRQDQSLVTGCLNAPRWVNEFDKEVSE